MGANTSLISAVNTLLSTIGESPVSSLSTANLWTSRASDTIDEISRAVQAEGWHFNTEHEVEYVPDVDGFVSFSDDVLLVDTGDINQNYCYRNEKLYNLTDHTDVFDEDTISLTIVRYLDWASLPEPAKRYIMVRAARVFQDRHVGSVSNHAFSERDEMEAKSALNRHEGDTGDYTIFDNFTAARGFWARPQGPLDLGI